MKPDLSDHAFSLPPPGRRGFFASIGRSWRFVALVVRKVIDDDLSQQAAALAFITMLSLVPLLATFSFLFDQLFAEKQQGLIQILTFVLPYSEQQVLAQLDQFLSEAQQIRGFGFLAFLFTALLAFTQIESSLNRIWNVEARRPLRNRLLSFTLVLFWGPILIGVAYSGLYFLEQRPAFEALTQTYLAQLLPTLVTFCSLTVLYWQVPYTAVELRLAAIGGLIATLLFELLKRGFGYYVEIYDNISIIYGSFGLVLFFMISIQLAWGIVLLGSELTYCLQHFELLLTQRLPAAQIEGRWLALAALLVVTDRTHNGRPITSHERLAERLRITPAELCQAVLPLIEHRLLAEVKGETDGYMLACDPYEVQVNEVFELYERTQLDVLEPLSENLRGSLAGLRAKLTAGRQRSAGEQTVAGLLRMEPKEAPPVEEGTGAKQ